ncbi:hypothetical protein [Pedobacter helvus]|uniref:Uncharacterized protein n=1 Tax=Pedobacter helvus TaxID=2563444 RepID=A0ABW9JDK1_9SPHI|nr:hypothetical protein [Pedobacter ureilyticus]
MREFLSQYPDHRKSIENDKIIYRVYTKKFFGGEKLIATLEISKLTDFEIEPPNDLYDENFLLFIKSIDDEVIEKCVSNYGYLKQDAQNSYDEGQLEAFNMEMYDAVRYLGSLVDYVNLVDKLRPLTQKSLI